MAKKEENIIDIVSDFLQFNLKYTKNLEELLLKLDTYLKKEKNIKISDGILELFTWLYNYLNYIELAKKAGNLNIKYKPISIETIKSMYGSVLSSFQKSASDYNNDSNFDSIFYEFKKDVDAEIDNFLMSFSKIVAINKIEGAFNYLKTIKSFYRTGTIIYIDWILKIMADRFNLNYESEKISLEKLDTFAYQLARRLLYLAIEYNRKRPLIRSW